MLKRTLLSLYKLNTVNKHHNYICRVPIKRIIHYNTVMSSANKIVNFDDVQKATKNSSVYIIDVRESSELKETGEIPNSINIPLAEVESVLKNYPNDEFKQKFGREKPLNTTEIIFTCRSGKRAGMALETALKLGFNNSKSYGGSWLDWEEHTKQ